MRKARPLTGTGLLTCGYFGGRYCTAARCWTGGASRRHRAVARARRDRGTGRADPPVSGRVRCPRQPQRQRPQLRVRTASVVAVPRRDRGSMGQGDLRAVAPLRCRRQRRSASGTGGRRGSRRRGGLISGTLRTPSSSSWPTTTATAGIASDWMASTPCVRSRATEPKDAERMSPAGHDDE